MACDPSGSRRRGGLIRIGALRHHEEGAAWYFRAAISARSIGNAVATTRKLRLFGLPFTMFRLFLRSNKGSKHGVDAGLIATAMRLEPV